jgi:hypothetical protein
MGVHRMCQQALKKQALQLCKAVVQEQSRPSKPLKKASLRARRFLDGRVWPAEDERQVKLLFAMIHHCTGGLPPLSLVPCFRSTCTSSAGEKRPEEPRREDCLKLISIDICSIT